jgi:FkbM family methyltransferase
VPHVYNFWKALDLGAPNMELPIQLKGNGAGKVFVNVGLNDGLEFFAAIEKGFSVYGFEPDPQSLERLIKRCTSLGKAKCEVLDPVRLQTTIYCGMLLNCTQLNILKPIPPVQGKAFLIPAGCGPRRTTMMLSQAEAGSSLVEVAPGADPNKRKEVTIVRLDEVVDTDVWFMQIDVQGFEYGVLQGALKLFENRFVASLMFEYYPRGLESAKVDHAELVSFVWHKLKMFCSIARLKDPHAGSGFVWKHAHNLTGFVAYMDHIRDFDLKNNLRTTYWGTWYDFVCFNRFR